LTNKLTEIKINCDINGYKTRNDRSRYI